MSYIYEDADGTWARLDDGELCGPYRDRTELYRSIVGDMIGVPGTAPCCPWGSDPADWMPAAIALAVVYAGSDGRLFPTEDEAEAAASAIVNCGDSEAWELHDMYPELIPAPATERMAA